MQKDLKMIHEASMQILGQCGIRILHQDILDLIKARGIKVDGQTVYFTEEQLMHWVKKAPAHFKIHARNPRYDLEFGGDSVHFAPGYGAASIVEADGSVRPARLDDYLKFIKIFHQSSEVDLVGGIMVQPSDVESGKTQPLLAYLSLAHSDKCLLAGTGNLQEAKTILQMLALVFGGREEMIRQPRVSTIINMNSPLIIDGNMLENMIEYVAFGQPVVIASATMAGSTGPMTLAGTMALSNAEILSGIAVAQILREGTPVFYGNQTTTADMRSGFMASGSPEGALCYTTTARLAKAYGLPCRGGGAVTDAKSVSVQSGYESMMTLMACAEAKMNLIIHSAGILDSYNSMSFEQCIVDLELIGMVKRYMKGIDVRPETLAVEVIREVGSGGHFLDHAHTMAFCRREPFIPAISQRGPVTGNPNQRLDEKIQEKITKMTTDFQPAALPAGLNQAVISHLRAGGFDPEPYL